MKKAFPVSIIYYIIAFLILAGGFVTGGIIADSVPLISGLQIQSGFNFPLALLIWTGTLIVFSLSFAIALSLHRQEKILNILYSNDEEELFDEECFIEEAEKEAETEKIN